MKVIKVSKSHRQNSDSHKERGQLQSDKSQLVTLTKFTYLKILSFDNKTLTTFNSCYMLKYSLMKTDYPECQFSLLNMYANHILEQTHIENIIPGNKINYF